MSRGNRLWQTRDDGVVQRTGATHIGIHRLASKQRHILGLQVQVGEQAVVDGLHLVAPAVLTIVGLTLMEQDALDDTTLLSDLCHIDEALVGIVVVGSEGILHPVLCRLEIRFHLFRHEAFDINTANGYIDHTHTYILWQGSHHRTAEVVGHTDLRPLTHQRRGGVVPLAHLTDWIGKVGAGHHLKARVDTLVDGFWLRLAFHVRLSETQVDVEVLIHLCAGMLHPQQQQCTNKENFFHIHCFSILTAKVQKNLQTTYFLSKIYLVQSS